MRLPRSVQHKLRSIAIFECCRALHGRAACAQRLHDLPGKDSKTARPVVVTHSASKLAAISFDSFPIAVAYTGLPQRVIFDHVCAAFAEDFETMLRLSRLDHRERSVSGGALS